MYCGGIFMQHVKSAQEISVWEAIIITILVIGGVSYSIIGLEVTPHIPIIFAIITLILYGLCKRVSVSNIEEGIFEGAKSGIGAIFIFFFIGMLISSWMASGTIPTFIYLALETVNGQFYYAIVFIVTSLIGLSIGSSLTTAATLGVAFMSISSALGLSDAITAGAVISGAFFGDKMSPLSDTTNLASMIVKVDLFEHIKNMAWTTIPAFALSFIFFAFLSPQEASADFQTISLFKETLKDLGFIKWYSLIPFAILALLAIKKVPSILTLSAGVISAAALAFFVQNDFSFSALMTILFAGFQSDTGVEQVDSLLNRGGMESMFFSISLVLLALGLGGLFIKLGILPALLKGIQNHLKKVPVLITAAACTAIGINITIGEQYLSILLTGSAFQNAFTKAGLHLKNLSRVLEDAGTVINPLVPWSVCGVFLTGVLDVSTMEYLPFAFFCLLSPVLTILYGITGLTIKKNS